MKKRAQHGMTMLQCTCYSYRFSSEIGRGAKEQKNLRKRELLSTFPGNVPRFKVVSGRWDYG